MRSLMVSLDLDNLWCYLRTNGDANWKSYPTFLPQVLPRVESFFAHFDIKPTVFLIGADLHSPAERKFANRISESGWELANHSFSHRTDFHSLSSSEIYDEIGKCEKEIEEICGIRPIGFRGPSFQISASIINALIERGYRYDASSYPTSIAPLARKYHFFRSKLDRAGKKAQSQLFGSFANTFKPIKPFHWQSDKGSILEMPLSTMPISRLPIHFTYLNYAAEYSESAATAYLSTALKLLNHYDVTPLLLLHATDFIGSDDAFCPQFLPGMKRPLEKKLKFLENIFEKLSNSYISKQLCEWVDEHDITATVRIEN